MNWDGRGWRTSRCSMQARFDLLTSRKLAVVLLSSNHWPTLLLVAAQVATAVDFVHTRQIVRVDVAILLGRLGSDSSPVRHAEETATNQQVRSVSGGSRD